MGVACVLWAAADGSDGPMNDDGVIKMHQKGLENVKITVVYDNNPYKEGLETEWGFGAVIAGAQKTILFDTGGNDALIRNMAKLKIDLTAIDTVIISHNHWDHTGGLDAFLAKNHSVAVYAPISFPDEFKDKVRNSGATLVEVDKAKEVCPNIYLTGQMGDQIIEQSLAIRSDKGQIVLTGCAHPGIVKIVQAVKEMTNEEILLAMGGFHLKGDSEEKIEQVVEAFEELGVRYAAPTHCTGDKARTLFKQHYKDKYLPVGAGYVLKVAELK